MINNKTIFYLSFRIIWLLFTLLVWAAVMTVFISDVSFGTWMIWGFACTLLMIPTAFKFFVMSVKSGYEEGKHYYGGSFFDNGFGGVGMRMHDKRYSTAIITLIIGVVAFLFFGPILLIGKIIIGFVRIIKEMWMLKRASSRGGKI